MKLLQTTDEELARDFESFLENRQEHIKPFLNKAFVRHYNAEYASFCVGYQNIRGEKKIPPYLEKAVFKEDEVRTLLYDSGRVDY